MEFSKDERFEGMPRNFGLAYGEHIHHELPDGIKKFNTENHDNIVVKSIVTGEVRKIKKLNEEVLYRDKMHNV